MSTTTLVGIKALLKAKIDGILVGGKSVFGYVSDIATGNFTGYPAVVITPTEANGEVLDTGRNERTFKFTIDLYQEQSEVGKTKTEAGELLEGLVDTILETFDQDKNLSNEVVIVKVVTMRFDFEGRKGVFNFASFEIECVVVVPNYS